MDVVFKPFTFLFVNISLIYKLSLDEAKKRNAGSILGNAWLVISPLFFLALYSVVYLVIFNFRPMNMDKVTYIVYIFCGLLPFLLNAESWGVCLGAVSGNQTLFKNAIFPLEVLPVKTVLASTLTFLCGMGSLLILDLLFSTFSLLNLFVVVIFILHLMFLLGTAWILSILSLFFQDVKNIITYINMTLMITSPIAYSPDMVPEILRFIIWFNPVAYFIMSYQHVVALNRLPPVQLWIGMLAFAVVSFVSGYYFFQKTKRVAANYV